MEQLQWILCASIPSFDPTTNTNFFPSIFNRCSIRGAFVLIFHIEMQEIGDERQLLPLNVDSQCFHLLLASSFMCNRSMWLVLHCQPVPLHVHSSLFPICASSSPNTFDFFHSYCRFQFTASLLSATLLLRRRNQRVQETLLCVAILA